MARYRWESPRDWLEWAVHDRHITFREAFYELLEVTDYDAIQDIFQNEMQLDGYFVDLDDLCAYCGHPRGKHDQYGCVGDDDCHCDDFEEPT